MDLPDDFGQGQKVNRVAVAGVVNFVLRIAVEEDFHNSGKIINVQIVERHIPVHGDVQTGQNPGDIVGNKAAGMVFIFAKNSQYTQVQNIGVVGLDILGHDIL